MNKVDSTNLTVKDVSILDEKLGIGGFNNHLNPTPLELNTYLLPSHLLDRLNDLNLYHRNILTSLGELSTYNSNQLSSRGLIDIDLSHYKDTAEIKSISRSDLMDLKAASIVNLLDNSEYVETISEIYSDLKSYYEAYQHDISADTENNVEMEKFLNLHLSAKPYLDNKIDDELSKICVGNDKGHFLKHDFNEFKDRIENDVNISKVLTPRNEVGADYNGPNHP